MNKVFPILAMAAALAAPYAPTVRRIRARRGAESIDEVLERARSNRGEPAMRLADALGYELKPLLLRAAP